MLRRTFSFGLTFLILLSQVGVPMHFHYCKGALESVSILIKKTCNDADMAVAGMPACCKKFYAKQCEKKNNGCCHDQVKVFNQDLTSVVPGYLYWMPALMANHQPLLKAPGIITLTISAFSPNSNVSDSGPPIYIRFHSLIYYA